MPRDLFQTITFLAGLWLALTLLLPFAAHSGERTPAQLATLETRLFEEANQIRGKHHRIVLVRNEELDRVARAHSEDMRDARFFAHDSPTTGSPAVRVERAGLGRMLVLQNIGRGVDADALWANMTATDAQRGHGAAFGQLHEVARGHAQAEAQQRRTTLAAVVDLGHGSRLA